MRKKIIFILLVLLIFALSSVVYAAENPFKGLTQEQVVQKFFEGRKLDLIEGIWIRNDNEIIKTSVIIKTNLVSTDKEYSKYDYLIIDYSTSTSTEIVGVQKTEYPSFFKRGKLELYLQILSPTVLHFNDRGYDITAHFYSRIYPNEVK